jgi:hypothetical protein
VIVEASPITLARVHQTWDSTRFMRLAVNRNYGIGAVSEHSASTREIRNPVRLTGVRIPPPQLGGNVAAASASTSSSPTKKRDSQQSPQPRHACPFDPNLMADHWRSSPVSWRGQTVYIGNE